jgi:hypothetical protein
MTSAWCEHLSASFVRRTGLLTNFLLMYKRKWNTKSHYLGVWYNLTKCTGSITNGKPDYLRLWNGILEDAEIFLNVTIQVQTLRTYLNINVSLFEVYLKVVRNIGLRLPEPIHIFLVIKTIKPVFKSVTMKINILLECTTAYCDRSLP